MPFASIPLKSPYGRIADMLTRHAYKKTSSARRPLFQQDISFNRLLPVLRG